MVFDNPEGLLGSVSKEFGWSENHPAFQAPLEKINHPAFQAPLEKINHPAFQAPLLEKEGNRLGTKNSPPFQGGVPEGGGGLNTKPVPEGGGGYMDIPGYCKSAKLEDIKANDYVLTPGRYVGVAEEEDDGIPFETKMGTLSQLLKEQMEQSNALDTEIQNNLKVLGYE